MLANVGKLARESTSGSFRRSSTREESNDLIAVIKNDDSAELNGVGSLDKHQMLRCEGVLSAQKPVSELNNNIRNGSPGSVNFLSLPNDASTKSFSLADFTDDMNMSLVLRSPKERRLEFLQLGGAANDKKGWNVKSEELSRGWLYSCSRALTQSMLQDENGGVPRTTENETTTHYLNHQRHLFRNEQEHHAESQSCLWRSLCPWRKIRLQTWPLWAPQHSLAEQEPVILFADCFYILSAVISIMIAILWTHPQNSKYAFETYPPGTALWSGSVAWFAVCNAYGYLWMATRAVVRVRVGEWRVLDSVWAVTEYYLNTWFFFDLLMIFPFDIVLLAIGKPFAYYMLQYRNLPRLVRVIQIGKSSNALFPHRLGFASTVFALATLLITFLIAAVYWALEGGELICGGGSYSWIEHSLLYNGGCGYLTETDVRSVAQHAYKVTLEVKRLSGFELMETDSQAALEALRTGGNWQDSIGSGSWTNADGWCLEVDESCDELMRATRWPDMFSSCAKDGCVMWAAFPGVNFSDGSEGQYGSSPKGFVHGPAVHTLEGTNLSGLLESSTWLTLPSAVCQNSSFACDSRNRVVIQRFNRRTEDAVRFVDACYWTIATLSGVGYGDVVTRTNKGKVLACVGMIVGVVMVTLATTLATLYLTTENCVAADMTRRKNLLDAMLKHYEIPSKVKKQIVAEYPLVEESHTAGLFAEMTSTLPPFIAKKIIIFRNARFLQGTFLIKKNIKQLLALIQELHIDLMREQKVSGSLLTRCFRSGPDKMSAEKLKQIICMDHEIFFDPSQDNLKNRKLLLEKSKRVVENLMHPDSVFMRKVFYCRSQREEKAGSDTGRGVTKRDSIVSPDVARTNLARLVNQILLTASCRVQTVHYESGETILHPSEAGAGGGNSTQFPPSPGSPGGGTGGMNMSFTVVASETRREELVSNSKDIIKNSGTGEFAFFVKSGVVEVLQPVSGAGGDQDVCSSLVSDDAEVGMKGVTTLRAGHCFGNMAFVNPRAARTTRFHAATPCEIVMLPLQSFHSMRQRFPEALVDALFCDINVLRAYFKKMDKKEIKSALK